LVPYYANSTNPAAKPLLEGALETALDHNRRHMALAIISGCVALQANRLHKAVAQDDSVTILSILATNSIAANTKDLFGWTPLHLAAFSGNTGVAEVLLSHQANEDSQDDIHNTPLHYAAYLGHEDFVALMLRHKANMDVQGTFSGFESGGDRPLDFAIEQGFTSIAAMLITNGANLGAHKWWGDTPLHIATAKENVPVMKLLLSHGARVNVVRGDYKQSPLDIAVCGNSPEAVRLLLNSGANLQTSMRAESRTNTSLVHLWAHTGNTNIAEQLLAAGLDVNARDGNGQTPLHIAIGKWPADFKEEATLWLLSHNANVNAKDKSGRTPLHLAASCGSTKAVRLLLDHKAEANSSDNNGKTPLALLEDTKIAQSRHSIGGMVNLKEAEKLLVEHGAEGPILEPETNRWSRFR
jgi:ankyrin repeat protein